MLWLIAFAFFTNLVQSAFSFSFYASLHLGRTAELENFFKMRNHLAADVRI